MSVYRRASKRDENEPQLVRALQAMGAAVEYLSGTGRGHRLDTRRNAEYLFNHQRHNGRANERRGRGRTEAR